MSKGKAKIPKKFTMTFKPATIEQLGYKLYHSLPPVIGELISNSWDADAVKVEIELPKGRITKNSEVVVRDYGKHVGLDADSIQELYLPIGRKCREELGRDTSRHKRRGLMGRKGIGKLSAFGVASELELRTIKDGFAICIKLDYDQMRAWPHGEDYEPTIVRSRCGVTSEPNGTEVRLRRLRRRSPIDEERMRRGIARRYLVFGPGFKVSVNGKAIKYEDRRMRRECKKVWNVTEVPAGATVDESMGWTVSGWIGIVPKTSHVERGVDIFARKKGVELDSMFALGTTHIQFARAYVVGEIQAEFLDAEEDNISTGRSAVHWESPEGQALEKWGQATLRFVFKEWLAMWQKEKEEKIIKTAGFDKWLSTRTKREQRIAKKLIKTIVTDSKIEPESAGPLLEIIKTNVEFEAFQELVDELEETGMVVETFLTLVRDWRLVESRIALQQSDGRLTVMEKLSECISKGALEVKQMQPLFEDNGWLVNPVWGEVSGQTSYSMLLRKNCKEPAGLAEENRRIDILGYSVGSELSVVELKRPQTTLSRSDLNQIEDYIDWARTNLMGTGESSPKYVIGRLIVGKLSSKKQVQAKMQRLAGSDIRVETYVDLLERARKIFGQTERRLRKIAPEYSRKARKKRTPTKRKKK